MSRITSTCTATRTATHSVIAARNMLAGAITAAAAALLLAAVPLTRAHASEASDCMFDCGPAKASQTQSSAEEPQAPLFCKPAALVEVEAVGNKVKQVKDIVNLIQSPTGIALKLVNDHVVQIPEWVGYVADPKGAVKNKVMSMARSEIKKATGLDRPCTPATDAKPSANDAELSPPESVDSAQIFQ
jgi:hypothetical protein